MKGEKKKGKIVANKYISRLKRKRLVDPKDKNPRKQKLQQIDDGTSEDSSSIKQAINIMSKSSYNIDPLEEIQVPRNNEIFINYVHIGEILDQNKIVINDVFAFKVAFDITRSDNEIEP